MKINKIAFIMLAVLLFATLTTVFVACDGSSGDKDLDDAIKSGKLILNVATYDGGIGTDWIKQSKTEFEALYANTKFGDKTGVYVNTVGNKQMGGNTIENDSLKYDVYFTEMVNYYSFVNKGKLADISDIVKGAYPTEFGAGADEGTIESKLQPSWQQYLTAKDGKYYGIYILTERPGKGKNRLNLHDPGEDGGDLTGDWRVEIDRDDEDHYYRSKYHPYGRYGTVDNTKYITYQYDDPEYEDFADLPAGTEKAIQKSIDDMEDCFAGDNYKDPVNGYRKYIDVTSFIDYMLSLIHI